VPDSAERVAGHQPARASAAWPRRAVLWSSIGVVVGVLLVLGGLAAAADRSGQVQATTLAAAAGAAVLWAVLVTSYTRRWLTGSLTPRFRTRTLVVSIAVAVTLFLLARSDTGGPPGTAGLGGAVVGALIANILAVRRTRSLPHP
jgi:hypothetical protein